MTRGTRVQGSRATKLATHNEGLVIHYNHPGGFLSQCRTQCRLFYLNFVFAGHPHFDSVVACRESVLPLGSQRAAGIGEFFERGPKESEHRIITRLPAPRQAFVQGRQLARLQAHKIAALPSVQHEAQRAGELPGAACLEIDLAMRARRLPVDGAGAHGLPAGYVSA